MMNRTKYIFLALPLLFVTTKGVAQGAYSDLMNAWYYSNQAANSSSPEGAYSNAANAFNGGGYSGSPSHGKSHKPKNNNSSGYGSTVSRSSQGKRAKTDMSKVGLHYNSSGYNYGAARAERNRQIREEMARRKKEREARMLADYMRTVTENADKVAANRKYFIYQHSHARPLSFEEINDFIANGVYENIIIEDETGKRAYLPEMLLEGSGATHETLADKIFNMSDEEIDLFAEELERRFLNGEKLTDEESDFLYSWEMAEIAKLEEQLEEERIKEKVNEGVNKQLDILNDFNIK